MSEKVKMTIVRYPASRKLRIGDLEIPIISSCLSAVDDVYSSRTELEITLNLDMIDIIEIEAGDE